MIKEGTIHLLQNKTREIFKICQEMEFLRNRSFHNCKTTEKLYDAATEIKDIEHKILQLKKILNELKRENVKR